MDRRSENSIRERAADWVTRIQAGDIGPDNAERLRAWLSESPEHERVFRQMLDVFTASTYVAEQYTRESQPAAQPEKSRSGYGFAAAASVALAVVAGFWALSGPDLSIETQTGERILMSLEDGSSVHLNSQSSVEIEFTEDARIATLPRGEVLFDVNDADPRPFYVLSDGVDVRVTGTTFQVTHYGDDAVVAVIEGEVRVGLSSSGMNGDGNRAVTLRRGEQVLYSGRALGAPSRADISRITGWQEGWLYLEDQPLQELVDRLNRHYDGRIEIRDRELAASKVSIALKLDRRQSTLARVERVLPLEFETLPGERSVVRARR